MMAVAWLIAGYLTCGVYTLQHSLHQPEIIAYLEDLQRRRKDIRPALWAAYAITVVLWPCYWFNHLTNDDD